MGKKSLSTIFTAFFLLFINIALADTNASKKDTVSNSDLKSEIINIDENIKENNWIITHENYNNYQALNLKKK
jgi:hypothetical protein